MPGLHLLTAIFALLCVGVAAVDLRTRRIPDLLNAAILVSGFCAAWLLGRDLGASLIGAAAGYGALALVNWSYRRARGRDGIGMGDAKFLGAAGAWIGWAALPFALLLASALALAWVALARLLDRPMSGRDAIAFGPFLAAGAFACWAALGFYF